MVSEEAIHCWHIEWYIFIILSAHVTDCALTSFPRKTDPWIKYSRVLKISLFSSSRWTWQALGYMCTCVETRQTCPAVCQSEGSKLRVSLIIQGLHDHDRPVSRPRMHAHKQRNTYFIVSLSACTRHTKSGQGQAHRDTLYCSAGSNNELYVFHIKTCLCSISTDWMQWIWTDRAATADRPFSFHTIRKSLFLIILKTAAERRDLYNHHLPSQVGKSRVGLNRVDYKCWTLFPLSDLRPF